MSCVHYKFKSSLEYQTVTFDGLHISLGDLKKAISQHKKLKPGEYNLEITNAQTREVYVNNSELIPKNSSVIVSRIPIQTTTSNSTSKAWEAFKQECAKAIQQEKEMVTLEDLKKTADLASAKATEMDKIKAMIDQSTKDFDPSNYKTKSLPTGPPPSTYRCYRCNQAGHYIHNCPNPKLKVKTTDEDGTVHELEPKLKRSTGIPNSLLTYVNNPLLPGVLLTHSGKFAVPTLDVEAYIRGKKEKPPFLPSSDHEVAVVQKQFIPKDLMCPICEDLLRDAVITPCCGNSFCDECIRNALVESEDHECPQCHETDVSPNQLTQNKFHRMAVTNFLNETSMLNEQKEESPPPPPPPYPPPQEVAKQPKPPLPPAASSPPLQIRNTSSESVSSRRGSSENNSSYNSHNRSHHHSSDKSYSHSDRPHHHHERPPYHHSERLFSSRSNLPRQPQLTVVPIQGMENHSSPTDESAVRDDHVHSSTDLLVDNNAQKVPSLVGRSGVHSSNAQSSDSDDLRPPGTEKVVMIPEKLSKEDDILEKWLEYEKKYDKKNVVPPAAVTPAASSAIAPAPQPYPAVPPVISIPAQPLLPPPPVFMAPPTGAMPVPIPNVMPPIAAPPGFPGQSFLPGPARLPFPAAPFPPVPKPLTKHEFYREQDRLRKQESEIRKRDFMDDFEQELREKKAKKIIPKPVVKLRSRSRTYSRSLSRSPRPRKRSKTRSHTRSRSRSRVYSRSRSRSFSRGARLRSRSPRMRSRSRSFTRSPRRRSRTHSRSRHRSFSRSRTRSRSRKRSRLRSRSWTRSRSRSFTPLPRKLSRSRSRSPFSRRKSPLPYNHHSHSPLPPKRFRPKGGKDRGFNRDRSPYPRYPNQSPPRHFPSEQYPPFGYDVQKQDPYYTGMYQSGLYPGYGGDKWGYPPVPPGVAPVAPPFDGYLANPGPAYRRSRSKSPWKFGSGGPIPPGEVENWSRGDKHWNDGQRPDGGHDMMKDPVNDRRNMAEGWDRGSRREMEPRWEMEDRWNPSDRRTQDDGKRDGPDWRDRDTSDRRDRDLPDRRDRSRKDHPDRKEIYDRKDPHYKKSDLKHLDDKPKESSEKLKQSKERRDKGKIDKENKENTNQDRKSDVKSTKEHGKKSVEKSDDERKIRKPPKESKTKEEKVVRKKDDEKDEARTKVVKSTEGKKKKLKVGKTAQDNSNVEDSEAVSRNIIKKKDANVKPDTVVQAKPKAFLKAKTRMEASDGNQSDNMPGKLKVKRVKKKRLKSIAEPTSGDAKSEQTDAAPEFDLRQKLKKRTLSQSQETSDDSSPTKRMKRDTSTSEVRGSQIQVLSRMKPIPIKTSASPKDEMMSVMPELSKWERDDYEEEVADDSPKTVTDKKPLPRSVIESAEKVLSQKQMKPSSVASAVASVSVRSRPQTTSPTEKTPHRRVYLENLKTVDGEDRRVSNKQKSIEVTISSDKVESRSKRSFESHSRNSTDTKVRTEREDSHSRTTSTDSKVQTEREECDINSKRDSKRSSERASRSDESRGSISKSKEDRSSEKERVCEFRDTREIKEAINDRDERSVREGKQKTKNENNEKDKPHESKEEKPSKERSTLKEKTREKEDSQDDKESTNVFKTKHSDSESSSRKQKTVSTSEQETVKSPNVISKSHRPNQNSVDTEVEKQSNQNSESISDSKSTKSHNQPKKEVSEKTQKPLDRKESIIDEATFEPDYEESAESDSDNEVASRDVTESSRHTHTASSASRSISPNSDDDTSPTKKQKTDDEKHKSKKAKHKKHKHKTKHSKHKHKHKKHKKHSRDEKEEKLT